MANKKNNATEVATANTVTEVATDVTLMAFDCKGLSLVNEINGHKIPLYTGKNSETLNTANAMIAKLNRDEKRNSLATAAIFGFVRSSKIYRPNFEKFEEYALDALGVERAQANNYAKVGERFTTVNAEIDENGDIVSAEIITNPSPLDVEQYSITALVEISSLNDDALEIAIENEWLSPAMSIKEIKESIKAHFPKKTKTTEIKETTEIEETTETEETTEIVGNAKKQYATISYSEAINLIQIGKVITIEGRDYMIEPDEMFEQ